MLHDRAADFGNCLGERDVLGADLDAVLRIAALLDAAVAHQRREPLALEFLAGGMCIEEPYFSRI